MVNRVIAKLSQRWMSLVPEVAVKRERRAPVVSFTFDDFPRTSWTIGGRVLEDAGYRGTYFVSATFSPQRLCEGTPFGMLEGTTYYEIEDLVELHDHGHEMGCHTFDHFRVPDQTTSEIESAIANNAEFVRNALRIDLSLRSFAYPQGAVSPRTRQILSRHFASCRGTRYGVNAGWIDLALLQAIVVGDRFDPKIDLPPLIEQAKRRNGWLIFCAHDIQEKPSRWGCTPDVFEEIVRQVRRAGIEVSTIDQITSSESHRSC
jgi:peptidoglycan/xylan/chitin deacetylase (PgdA/CDA1 family)